MQDEPGPWEVTSLTVRQTPTVTPGGRTGMQTSITFMVGQHGPFAIVYGGTPNAAQITKDVTEKVDELRRVHDAVRQLNQATRTTS